MLCGLQLCYEFQFSLLISQLESTLREKSQQLESLQEMKVNLEEQLKKETAAKVIMFVGRLVYKMRLRRGSIHLVNASTGEAEADRSL